MSELDLLVDSVDRVRAELADIGRTLGGWYDDDKKQWNEGLDSKLDTIANALDLDRSADDLTAIRLALDNIGKALKGADEIKESIARFFDTPIVVLSAKLEEINSRLGVCTSLGVILSAISLGILGTLRHWF